MLVVKMPLATKMFRAFDVVRREAEIAFGEAVVGRGRPNGKLLAGETKPNTQQ